jgi:TetR/AcrR family transcriptional regulator
MQEATIKAKRDAAGTRRRIVEAATAEFAGKGYDGARVDAIAQRAGVNKNLIYHYFGSKEQLFIAVMEEMYLLMRAHHKELELKQLEPRTAMAALVRATFQLFVEHPEVISLLNSENLHRARHVKKSQAIQSLYNPLLAALHEILERGEAAGVFRTGVDPVDLYISISALGYFYVSNQHTLGFIFGQDLLDERRVEQREAHAVEVILGYLRPPAPTERARESS